jgi:hypothetical protein
MLQRNLCSMLRVSIGCSAKWVGYVGKGSVCHEHGNWQIRARNRKEELGM